MAWIEFPEEEYVLTDEVLKLLPAIRHTEIVMEHGLISHGIPRVYLVGGDQDGIKGTSPEGERGS